MSNLVCKTLTFELKVVICVDLCRGQSTHTSPTTFPNMFLTSEEVIFTCLDVVHVAVAPVGAGDGPQLEAAFWPSLGPSTWNLSI